MKAPEPMAEGDTTEAKSVWLRAFYGFNPEDAGYIGFTKEGDRESMMARMQTGDLVLIYGAVDELTAVDQQQQALGFLEIERERCVDRDRMAEASKEWKKAHGFEDRWTHGIKVRRAWRVNNRVHIRSVAPIAYANKYRFERTTRAILLTPEERKLALSHTVRQVNVFGEPPIPIVDLGAGQMEKLLKPSPGIPPSYGEHVVSLIDGDNSVYLMIFSNPAEFVLGPGNHSGHVLAKVGRSNDPARRVKELNAGFPSTAVFRWKLIQTQTFSNGATAHAREDELKAQFDSTFRSWAGEFFTGPEAAIRSHFHEFCCANSPKILGAPGTAKGAKK